MPQPLTKPGSVNVAQAFAQALQFHERGELAQAEPLYAQVLAARPDHFDALQMMALVKLAKGQAAEALNLVSAAMRVHEPSPKVLLNHGLILDALERREEALESFDRAIKLKSKYPEAHNNRGAVLGALHRDDEALEAYRKAILLKPNYAEAHYNRGSLLRTLGRYDEALVSLDRALALNPKYVKAHNNRGAVQEALDRLDSALASYQRALDIDPAFSEAADNLGRLLVQLKRYDEAHAAFERQLQHDPNNAEAYYRRGAVLIELNRNDDAIADFQRALALKPDYPEARFAECMAELPIVYETADEIPRRRAAYEAKLRALVDDVTAGRLAGDLVAAIRPRQPFLLAYQGQNDRDLQSLYGGMVSHIVSREFPAVDMPPPPEPDEPLRIGVVSSFFYLHSNWKIPIKGWLDQLDRSRFRIYGYYPGTVRDAETDVAEDICDRFIQRTLDVEGWRREILLDAPHVLIYPGLLMDAVSVQLAAQRLAPVQCTSWGHPETSGIATLDYFLSSDLMEPPDADALYTEKLVRLPNLSIYYEPVDLGTIDSSRAQHGLRTDATVFWCGQSLYKYLPQHDDVFARIASEAPQSQFVFIKHHGGPRVTEVFQQRLTAAFAARGLDMERHCVFLDRLSQSEFAGVIGLCDVFLDSLGWSGCNSAIESLPHALPIVTLPGAFMRGRHSAAILEMMGVTETVARDLDDYVAIAARLAKSPDERLKISNRMGANRDKIYRDRACVTALEDFLEKAVRG
jgi:protein O-GlcNAc transferase